MELNPTEFPNLACRTIRKCVSGRHSPSFFLLSPFHPRKSTKMRDKWRKKRVRRLKRKRRKMRARSK
ncbi:hypothetical protein N7508_001967 [Penicillium antarcticum]|nr:uncharacterized protein N7508_001967 [Penicillium antarcticum]KAJ5317459.1 hypothetical protein N7508_001967 [Penicillium antarcticum]